VGEAWRHVLAKKIESPVVSLSSGARESDEAFCRAAPNRPPGTVRTCRNAREVERLVRVSHRGFEAEPRSHGPDAFRSEARFGRSRDTLQVSPDQAPANISSPSSAFEARQENLPRSSLYF